MFASIFIQCEKEIFMQDDECKYVIPFGYSAYVFFFFLLTRKSRWFRMTLVIIWFRLLYLKGSHRYFFCTKKNIKLRQLNSNPIHLVLIVEWILISIWNRGYLKLFYILKMNKPANIESLTIIVTLRTI